MPLNKKLLQIALKDFKEESLALLEKVILKAQQTPNTLSERQARILTKINSNIILSKVISTQL